MHIQSPEPADVTTIQVWLTYKGRLFATSRTRPATLATSRLALTELFAGPTAQEREAGVTNAVTDSTTFDIKGIAGGTATVAFSSGLFAGGRDLRRMRQAQVVHTLTQFPTVSRVRFLHNNDPFEQPYGRADLACALPPILVLQPVLGQRVTSPVTVSGTASTREATVNARVLDASGQEIGARFTTATCGSGCRGTYSMTLPYQPCAQQRGTVEVFEVSGEDGTRVNEVRIPVTLAGC
ncbi:Gmad2 immunoglobulin-like domain-containing protein [Allorhizocola rhizosphaerae]|uniref:Gmad2 immunoglobulin-like domain-containing protein n=1 Tax=Allorhizocola rhizosphaerae TaxID=1872709 RepID=UPI001FE42070|nr:Gmad2 immunoglobulin-like domain-containing protein [Allorhizocola rhizosphaerae]